MHFVQKEEMAFLFLTIIHLVVDVLWFPGPPNTFSQTWHSMQRKIKTCLTSVLWVVFNLNQLLLFSGAWGVRSGRKNKSTQPISRKQHICKLPDFPVVCAETTFSEGHIWRHYGLTVDTVFFFVLFCFCQNLIVATLVGLFIETNGCRFSGEFGEGGCCSLYPHDGALYPENISQFPQLTCVWGDARFFLPIYL